MTSLKSISSDVHLTNVAVQKTAPEYDPEKVINVDAAVHDG